MEHFPPTPPRRTPAVTAGKTKIQGRCCNQKLAGGVELSVLWLGESDPAPSATGHREAELSPLASIPLLDWHFNEGRGG